MRSAVVLQPGELVWRDVPAPVPADHEALVRVLRCGVCGTDIHALAGKQPFFSYPRRLGHELCVQVITAPPNAHVAAGELCAVEPYYSCNDCPACRVGRGNCCRDLRVLGVHLEGGHAPLLCIPAAKLHASAVLTPDQLAMVEPFAIGAHGVDRVAPLPHEPTLIVGLGPIGLAALLTAAATGANCVGIDILPTRVERATRLGLRAIAATGDWRSTVRGAFGHDPLVVIDATGNPTSMETSITLADHGGRVLFLGLHTGTVTFDDASFHRRELTTLASRAALPETFAKVIRLFERGRIDPRPLITHRLRFDEIVDRLSVVVREPGLVKAMIDFES